MRIDSLAILTCACLIVLISPTSVAQKELPIIGLAELKPEVINAEVVDRLQGLTGQRLLPKPDHKWVVVTLKGTVPHRSSVFLSNIDLAARFDGKADLGTLGVAAIGDEHTWSLPESEGGIAGTFRQCEPGPILIKAAVAAPEKTTKLSLLYLMPLGHATLPPR